MKAILIALTILVPLVFLGWVGIQIKPAPLAPYPEPSGELDTIPVPEGLPTPVERFYRTLYGDSIPVIESAVLSGRAVLRLEGVTMPGRFRFTHVAGQAYRHYIEPTFFGQPIIKVNEGYVDGLSFFQTSFAGSAGGDPKTNQASNLGLWAESLWLPSVFLTDPRVHWDPVDEFTALLVVPFEEDTETFMVRFDPQTSMPRFFEAMRYGEVSDIDKTLWIVECRTWGTLNGTPSVLTATATWLDEGTPWAVFTVEETAYNVAIDEYIHATGP